MMPLFRLYGLLVFLSFSCRVLVGRPAKSRGVGRAISIVNGGKNLVEILWVHPTTNEESQMSSGVFPGTEYNLDSFVGHKFVAREKPGKDGDCKNDQQVCRQAFFTVSESDNQMFRITEAFEIDVIDNKVKAQQEAGSIVLKCKAFAQKKIEAAGENKAAALEAMDELVKCVELDVSEALERVNEEISFQADVRKDIAASLENYTCMDDTLNSTEDLDSEIWTHRDGIPRRVHIKHERPASRIHVIENFIDEEECTAMETAASKKLHHATVADGKGGSRLSENRKAMQAGITVDWSKEELGDPIARLSRRVYDYVNHALGLDIKEHGQEDLMSIQYFGRGMDEQEPDRYTPHCDGDCTGLQHKYGQRMATVVLYCDVADRGGHTNFRNAGVHVKPERGNAVYFSYIDPKTKIMDTGFTEHSGCPVFEGTKRIVTQWVRYGVDTENPWDSFNTLGIKKSELEHLEFGDVESQLPAEAESKPEVQEDDDDDFDMNADDDEPITDDELSDDEFIDEEEDAEDADGEEEEF